MRKSHPLFFLLFFSTVSILVLPMTYYKGPKSDHFDGTQFFNSWERQDKSFFSVLKWKVFGTGKPWPKHVDNRFIDRPPHSVEGGNLRVSWVGHSTVLIQTEGLNILTDPVWSEKIGPLPGLKLRRVAEPGIAFIDLPKIDLILVSHNHYDHMDLPTIQKVWQRDQPVILCPLGNDELLRLLDPSLDAIALDWEESYEIQQVRVTLEPTQHWSKRGLWDYNKALWGSYVIQTAHGNLYFAGDTGYHTFLFKKLKEKYGSFRLACLPIGSYEPRWFMKYAHLSPEEATQVFLDLGSPSTVAIHFKTFHLSDEGYEAPAIDLEKTKLEKSIPQNRFRTLSIGEHWFIED